jgi:hypothetical protein
MICCRRCGWADQVVGGREGNPKEWQTVRITELGSAGEIGHPRPYGGEIITHMLVPVNWIEQVSVLVFEARIQRKGVLLFIIVRPEGLAF